MEKLNFYFKILKIGDCMMTGIAAKRVLKERKSRIKVNSFKNHTKQNHINKRGNHDERH